LLTNPSACFSAVSTASLQQDSVNHGQRGQQQATANSRSFRSLALIRTKASIGLGSVAASHSVSVIGSPPALFYDSAEQLISEQPAVGTDRSTTEYRKVPDVNLGGE
jgi:hypothetical protein